MTDKNDIARHGYKLTAHGVPVGVSAFWRHTPCVTSLHFSLPKWDSQYTDVIQSLFIYLAKWPASLNSLYAIEHWR